MNYQKQPSELVMNILKNRDIKFFDYEYYAFPYVFPSTAGPNSGIGGQTISTFTVEQYIFDMSTSVFICGTYYGFKLGSKPLECHVRHWVKVPAQELKEDK